MNLKNASKPRLDIYLLEYLHITIWTKTKLAGKCSSWETLRTKVLLTESCQAHSQCEFDRFILRLFSTLIKKSKVNVKPFYLNNSTRYSVFWDFVFNDEHLFRTQIIRVLTVSSWQMFKPWGYHRLELS